MPIPYKAARPIEPNPVLTKTFYTWMFRAAVALAAGGAFWWFRQPATVAQRIEAPAISSAAVITSPLTITTEKKIFSFGPQELTIRVEGPPDHFICLSPLPQIGKYDMFMSDGTKWAPGVTGHTATLTFRAPSERHIYGWLDAPCPSK